MKKKLFTLIITVLSVQLANAQWTTSGTNISNSNTGKVGIGTTNLFTPLAVESGNAAGVSQGLAINSSHAYGSGQGTAAASLVFSRNRTADVSAVQAEAQIAGGNVNETTSQGGFLGLYTNNSSNALTEALHIDALQRIGIGTASPGNNLQIMTASNATLGLSGTAANVRDFYFQTSGIARWALRADGTVESGSNVGSDFNIIGRDDSGVSLGSYFFIKRSTGNVGIGTILPTSKLSVMVGANEDRQIDFSLIGASLPSIQHHAYLGISDGVGTAPFDAVGDLYIAPRTSLSRAIRFVTYNGTSVGERMMLDGMGNLGIGTSNTSGYKLAVNGAAIATSMTVKQNTDWPDYVFRNNYKLPSLSALKTYIDQNHHLPDMPSAEQVAKEGLNLGEINKQLTKKVEELTLYMIDKDKQLNDQQKQLVGLTKTNNELQQQLFRLAEEVNKIKQGKNK